MSAFYKIIKEPTVWFGFIVSLLALLAYVFGKEVAFINDFGASLFNIILFSLVLPIIIAYHDRKRHIERQLEIIDDFKKWDSTEGHLRIAGAIRRLNKEGKTDIDFRGVKLTNFSFSENDIKNLSGSNFMGSGILNDINGSKFTTELENVHFSDVNCSNVCFCDAGGSSCGISLGFMFLQAKNLDFFGSNLTNANFSGAILEWDNHIADERDWYDYDEDDNGEPFRMQKHSPAFYNADLTNTSFKSATLKNADFREAVNVLLADFTGAKGLETCFFNEDDKKSLKALMLSN